MKMEHISLASDLQFELTVALRMALQPHIQAIAQTVTETLQPQLQVLSDTLIAALTPELRQVVEKRLLLRMCGALKVADWTEPVYTYAIEQVLNVAYAQTGRSLEDLRKADRHRHTTDARCMCAAALHNIVGLVLSKVGSLLDRDHSSIIYLLKRGQDLCDTDARFKAMFDRFMEEVTLRLQSAVPTEQLQVTPV